jgi:hypothetical protein
LKAKAEREASLKAAQARKTKENDAIKLEDMRDHTARRKLALKVFAYEVRRGISDEEFEGLAGGSAKEAAALDWKWPSRCCCRSNAAGPMRAADPRRTMHRRQLALQHACLQRLWLSNQGLAPVGILRSQKLI